MLDKATKDTEPAPRWRFPHFLDSATTATSRQSRHHNCRSSYHGRIFLEVPLRRPLGHLRRKSPRSPLFLTRRVAQLSQQVVAVRLPIARSRRGGRLLRLQSASGRATADFTAASLALFQRGNLARFAFAASLPAALALINKAWPEQSPERLCGPAHRRCLNGRF